MFVPLLNCDMGESFGNYSLGLDSDVMPHVDCANIACGFHASDPHVMRRTVRLAVEHGVRIGAHPAYPDLMGFGRRSMACSPEEVEDLVLYQIGALSGICQAEGTGISYVKPHGALYNDMARDADLLRAVMRAVRSFDPNLPLMLMATADPEPSRRLAAELDVAIWFETFADRAYDANGHLVSRRLPGAVHHDQATIVAQAVSLARGEPLEASDGTLLKLPCDTLCVHGDNPESVAAVRAIREAFRELASA
ncbi:LamB/YcsF family protein [Halomonas sp. MCCC 1A17488]|uniref:5-oxoprolinase subunit A n=1 Tax=Billgrantia sulfidoxydans TaxID=2733484 RepID=A0ABX7W3R6_9GAMM|nr:MULTISPECIES: 5-oxoprolinase subunit PxpA [Halomonas]MCE8015210.1 LamB/YcsF family protein [Halomonas sp. MCCC 1A17488]MCG3238543.1 LamB/YcsF family protein [Halomonas sp. MCCC 1A17488]QPP47720.1 LamB/YcsF family protein [Halomonas sp. SS10-MC5]QTP55026.1 LamB/YcsF family protein [Halomonas sulfidoxydans]